MQLPRGLFDVALYPLDETETPGTIVHNFFPRSLSPAYQADTFDIQGGDQRLEQGEFNERYEMTLEVAGMPFAAIAALEGMTVGTAGSGATLVTTINKNVNDDQRGYVRLIAQQKDKEGGATEYTFWRTSASGSPTFNMAQGEYMTPQIPLIAYPATLAVVGPPAVAVGDLYQVEQLATYGALA